MSYPLTIGAVMRIRTTAVPSPAWTSSMPSDWEATSSANIAWAWLAMRPPSLSTDRTDGH